MTVVGSGSSDEPCVEGGVVAVVAHPTSIDSDEPNSSSAATGSGASDEEAQRKRSIVATEGATADDTVRAASVDSDEPASSTALTGSDGGVPKRKKARLTRKQRVARIASAVSSILECLEDEPERAGLEKTPERYAKALLDLTAGYTMSASQVVGDANFAEGESEFVLVRDIAVHSLCEHHLLPFHGACHIAYVPGRTVLGLSKLARIVETQYKRHQAHKG